MLLSFMKKLLSSLATSSLKEQQTSLYMIAVLLCSFILHVLFMNNANLLVEEAYYWNYAQHLDWGYLDHPPMVAGLIKLCTLLFGTHEFSVRAASLLCWGVSAFFSYQLSELIHPRSGCYALILLATLPFFFFQSIIITPDVPLIAAWSGCLYFLYRALVLNEANNWYWAGMCLGLGMLSKYTIILLPLSSLGFMLTQSRAWFTRKEPYLAALISILIFTPVIYWNAQHEWASFIFQSTRRFNEHSSITIHQLLLVVLFYSTPMGFWELWKLITNKSVGKKKPSTAKRFIQYFTFLPLMFFIIHSLNHQVNFNWTGPLILAIVPWIASTMTQYPVKKKLWAITIACLLILYSSIFLWITYNTNELIQQKIFIKVIDWEDLIKKMYLVAQTTEQQYQQPVLFVPLDNYPINSELAFYQEKLLSHGDISKKYPTNGAHLFDRESLMYRYWAADNNVHNTLLILLAKEAWRFDDPNVTQHVIRKSQRQIVWSQGQGQNLKNIPYYYQVVQLKSKHEE